MNPLTDEATNTRTHGRTKAPAFNGRFEPPTIGGFPLYAVIGAGAALVGSSLALLMPWLVVRVLFGVIAAGGLITAIYFLKLGENIVFQDLMWEAFWERNLYTSDYAGEE